MDVDWESCIICQQSTKEYLRCPQKAHSFDSSIYSIFLDNVAAFRNLGCLPIELKFELDDTTLDTFIARKAKWHQSCHLKFSSSKRRRAEEKASKCKVKDAEDHETCDNNKRPQRGSDITLGCNKCIICNEEGGTLHSFCSLEADKNLRRIANNVKDFELLSRMSGGDLVAIEAKYHMRCLTNLRNRERAEDRRKRSEATWEAEEDERINESRAFVELIEFINDAVENDTHFFVLSELHSLYEARLKDLGIEKSVNRFRLKTRILQEFSEAQEQTDGRQTVIVFKKGLQSIVKEALKERDFSDDAIALARAAKIVRQDMFSHKGFKFSGAFSVECQEKSVPASLKTLVSLILNGVSLKEQAHTESQPCLTVCQTILFNAKKRSFNFERHAREREPPLPIYIGFSIHSLTRCKTLITKLYQLGLSASYDRVMEIQDWLATSMSQRFTDDGCVAPASLRKGVFSVGALDNIDHNPSSTTATSSFHGTGISIFQCATDSNPGQSRPPITIPPTGCPTQSLPDSYAVVPPIELKTTSISVPARVLSETDNTLDRNKAQESKWAEHSLKLLDKENLTSEDKIAWSAFHSATQSASTDLPVVSALLPLFYEKAATPAMIKHGMDVLKKATEFLNPSQIPVVALDQPLFALAKFVQWKWQETHGEDKFVVMFGGLHMEMALWNTLGDLLESSGWTSALVEAEIASSGVADSFLKASHLTRTR
jgi:hypothetical protein